MPQVDLINLKPLPPPPDPEPNVFMYCETITEVEEYYDEDEVLHERPVAKEITTKIFYCDFVEFNALGICVGGCDSDADLAKCMKLSDIISNTDRKGE